MNQEQIQSRVAAARDKVSKLREAKARVEERLKQDEKRLREIIDDLKSKIRRYQQYHDDVSNWISFGATDPGDSYYRVPLSMMP